MRNDEVAQAWSLGKRASSGRMYTDGVRIYSYSLLIGELDPPTQTLVAYDYTKGGGRYRSQTTSTHVGYVKRYAHVVK